MTLFCSNRWDGERLTTSPRESRLGNHLPTERLEVDFEVSERFVPADVVGELLDVLFEKGLIGIDDLRRITMDDSLSVAPAPSEANKGQVVRYASGKKIVIREDGMPLPPDVTIVCERPHDDGDFSYICGAAFCRCVRSDC